MTRRRETPGQRRHREAVEWLAADKRGQYLLSVWCRPVFETPSRHSEASLFEAGRRALAVSIWSDVATHGFGSLASVLGETYRERSSGRADGNDDDPDDGDDGPGAER